MYYKSSTEMKTYDTSFWLYQTIVKPVAEGDLDELENSAHEYLMRSNKSKCKVLHLRQGNPRCEMKTYPDRSIPYKFKRDSATPLDAEIYEDCVMRAKHWKPSMKPSDSVKTMLVSNVAFRADINEVHAEGGIGTCQEVGV
ncbi:hypothetical protein DUI87_09404 [Hirundo rustica rustica]|uniref:Uncharacterized protein n=1 Tax=Hirundo rustica rustica TaxID=333673 RepID=A0A3M0KNU2_HIRRU|nr:hypothetical protein DUI87_09404 [Hirundo rustica rustica]